MRLVNAEDYAMVVIFLHRGFENEVFGSENGYVIILEMHIRNTRLAPRCI